MKKKEKKGFGCAIFRDFRHKGKSKQSKSKKSSGARRGKATRSICA